MLLGRDDEWLLAVEERPRFLLAEAQPEQPFSFELRVAVRRVRDDILSSRRLQPDRCAGCTERAGGELDDTLNDLFEAVCDRELAAELEQRGRALCLPAGSLVQRRILERNCGVAPEYLQQPHVVLVELVEAELGEDDHADHARAEGQRHRDDRLVDRVGAGDLPRVLVVLRVPEQERLARRRDVAGEAVPDLHRQHVHRGLGHRRERPDERDRQNVLVLDREDAAVVVIDQRTELVRDHLRDLPNVVEPVQLPAETLEHLHVGD